MTPDYEHWFEALLGGLVALGGWLWRLGRKEQQQEDRIARLEQWRVSFVGEVRADIGRVEAETGSHFVGTETRLNRIEQKQHGQDIVLSRIEANQESQKTTLHEIKEDLRSLKGEVRPGGNRFNDPPLRRES